MAFWGVELKGEKPGCFVPPPSSSRLHLSQATLDINAPKGVRVVVSCRPSSGDGDEDELDEPEEQQIIICSLREGVQETCNLDLVFDHYTEFTVKGSDDAVVHLAGYHIPDDTDNDEDDELGLGEQDFSNGQLEALLQSRPDLLAQYKDSDDDSDDDDDFGEDESDEDESEEGTSDEEDDAPTQRNASVIIEDVTDAKEEVALEETDEDEESEEESEEEAPPAVVKGKKRKTEESAVQPAAKKISVEAKKGKAAKEVAPPAQKPAKQEGKQKPAKNGEAQDADGADKSKVKKFPNGFIIEETGMGDPAGKLAKAGKKVSVKYVGKLQKNGKVFDQSKGNKTFQFRLGVGEVIKGWDQGVVGMRIGDKRRLTVPPQMAYGSGGVKNVIPGNATLVFDVELTDVKG